VLECSWFSPPSQATPASLAIHVDLRPEWRDRVLEHYELVGLTLDGEPRRFVACALRRDVVERVMQAAQSAAR